MIVDERMVTYINSLDRGNTPFLNELEKKAREDRVPVIRREMQSFLKVLLQIKRPRLILEVGTAVGFSTRVLTTLEGPYDLIFMDAAKAQYIDFLPEVVRLLGPGGILVSDNVLQDGDLIESHFAVERRNRTIYKRMREYLYVLKNHEELETSILPLGDGVTLSIKKQKQDG